MFIERGIPHKKETSRAKKNTRKESAVERAKEKQEGSKLLTNQKPKGRRHTTDMQLGGVTGKALQWMRIVNRGRGKERAKEKRSSWESLKRTKQGAQPEGTTHGMSRGEREREDTREARNRKRTRARGINDLSTHETREKKRLWKKNSQELNQAPNISERGREEEEWTE